MLNLNILLPDLWFDIEHLQTLEDICVGVFDDMDVLRTLASHGRLFEQLWHGVGFRLLVRAIAAWRGLADLLAMGRACALIVVNEK